MDGTTSKELSRADLKDQAVGVASAIVKTSITTLAIAATGSIVAGESGVFAGVAAGLATELMSVVIPNFKQKRYDKFIEEFESRVQALEGDAHQRANNRMVSEEFADLFEDAIRQSSRAMSDERIDHIVSVLKNSLTDEQMEHAFRKRILELLSQINDVELLILQGKALGAVEAVEFWDRHRANFPPTIDNCTSPEELDQAIMHASYSEHLDDMGLLIGISRQKQTDFDSDGSQIKPASYKITELGRLLLHETGLNDPARSYRRIGLPTSIPWPRGFNQ